MDEKNPIDYRLAFPLFFVYSYAKYILVPFFLSSSKKIAKLCFIADLGIFLIYKKRKMSRI